MKTELERFAELKEKRPPFRKAIRVYAEGDFLTYFATEEECTATQINEHLTIYTGNETGKVVGVRLNGICTAVRIAELES
jgi:hypothetical protein